MGYRTFTNSLFQEGDHLMKKYPGSRLMLQVGTFLFFLVFFFARAQADENRLSVTNVTGSRFSVSWVTDNPCVGKIRLYRDTIYIGDYNDDRGMKFIGTTHYVTVSELEERVDYEIVVESDGQPLGGGDSPLQISTGPNLIASGSIQPAGRILLSDRQTPAAGAIVAIFISSSGVDSAPLSTLVDSNGYWYVELVNIRKAGNNELFNISPDADRIHISVYNGTGETAGFEGSIMDNKGGTHLYDTLIVQ